MFALIMIVTEILMKTDSFFSRTVGNGLNNSLFENIEVLRDLILYYNDVGTVVQLPFELTR